MMLGGKEYFFVAEPEQGDPCYGCAFEGDGYNCNEAMQRVSCYADKIIWVEAKAFIGTPPETLMFSNTEDHRDTVVPVREHTELWDKLQAEIVVGTAKEFTCSEREKMEKYPHYFRDIRHLNVLDIYRVLDLFSTGDSALDHAAKKILAAGKRGAKDKEKDIKEAIDTLTRRLEMLEEDKQK